MQARQLPGPWRSAMRKPISHAYRFASHTSRARRTTSPIGYAFFATIATSGCFLAASTCDWSSLGRLVQARQAYADVDGSGSPGRDIRAELQANWDANRSAYSSLETLVALLTRNFIHGVKTEHGGVAQHQAQVASNVPCEDFISAVHAVDGPNVPTWSAWSVFDGHAGMQTAMLANMSLPQSVIAAVNSDSPLFEGMKGAQRIKKAFVDLDNTLLDIAKETLKGAGKATGVTAGTNYSNFLPVFSGSCALMALFDHGQSRLYVAGVGDSRCVLGRYNTATGKYEAKALSNDHTGFNASEVARIEGEHPGESGIIDRETGRIFGLAVVRALGDARWKWDDATNMDAHKRFWGPKPRPGGVVKTPPYLTAEPEVTETDIHRGNNGDFIILASDGLWDHLSNDDAVLCVEEWLNRKAAGRLSASDETIEDEDTYFDERPGYGLSWRTKSEYFLYEDDNAATCLVKNAFGGRRRSLLARLLSTQPPTARDAHDDTSVQVIFFNEG